FRFGITPPVCGLITTTMAVDHKWHKAAPRPFISSCCFSLGLPEGLDNFRPSLLRSLPLWHNTAGVRIQIGGATSLPLLLLLNEQFDDNE
ncbi:MAG: hypothetical protein ACKPKO_40435, partial [Candidatus Fonsibacter sp.]